MICKMWMSCQYTKMKFSIKDFFSKYEQIRKKLKSLMENFIFCVVITLTPYH